MLISKYSSSYFTEITNPTQISLYERNRTWPFWGEFCTG